MLTVITPTGERPEAFLLCQRMMERQTYSGAVRWIVVDDGSEPCAPRRDGWDVQLVRPQPAWRPGDNTQGRNLLAGLERAEGVVVIVEDDDYYAPEWLSWVAGAIHDAELIGEGEAIYYNVRSRCWRALRNTEHASLRCTAMRDAAIDTFRQVLATPYRYYDQRLWARHENRKVFPRRLTVGMKAMPGRAGIALGHDGRGTPDHDGAMLRQLIGADAEWYAPFHKDEIMEKLIVVKPFRYAKRNWKKGEEFIPEKRIDGELHLHARKVERRSAKPKQEVKPAPEPVVAPPDDRSANVEHQETKVASTMMRKKLGISKVRE